MRKKGTSLGMDDRKRSEEGGELGSGERRGYSRGGGWKQEGSEVRVFGIGELSAGSEWWEKRRVQVRASGGNMEVI